jgi:hypothetical protein
MSHAKCQQTEHAARRLGERARESLPSLPGLEYFANNNARETAEATHTHTHGVWWCSSWCGIHLHHQQALSSLSLIFSSREKWMDGCIMHYV